MKKLAIGLFSMYGTIAFANVCGTDFQTFTPTIGGLGFITVHSSQTLLPCRGALGVSFNFAKNSLVATSQTDPDFNRKLGDELLYSDVSLGFGINKWLEIGGQVSSILDQQLDNPDGLVYTKTGMTGVRLQAKARLWQNTEATSGVAAVLSTNTSVIKRNPFTGEDAPTSPNFELVYDTIIADRWDFAANAGYRWRYPGAQVPSTPFEPLEDQWIYSLALGHDLSAKNRLVAEFYGSRAVDFSDEAMTETLESSEILFGFKRQQHKNMQIAAGAAAGIFGAVGSPDWRVFAGVTFGFDTWCDRPSEAKSPSKPATAPMAVSLRDPPITQPEIIQLNASVLFPTDSSDLMKSAQPEFLKLVKSLNQGFIYLLIEGHTDSQGSEAYNQELSERRAETIKTDLVMQHRFPSERIKTKGLGESVPEADNSTAAGRAKNRRVEFKIWRKP